MAANLGAQALVVYVFHGVLGILTSIVIGTGVGLLLKYALDKRYIFRFVTRNLGHDTQTFALYAIMGLLTTLVFWSLELSFDYLFRSEEMRYLGGAIGLAFGYLIKYQLDKRYVFREAAA